MQGTPRACYFLDRDGLYKLEPADALNSPMKLYNLLAGIPYYNCDEPTAIRLGRLRMGGAPLGSVDCRQRLQ